MTEAAARAALELVDRGWVTVHRVMADPAFASATYGPAIARGGIEEILNDPDAWDDPSDDSRHVELTLALTTAYVRAREVA